MLESYITPLLMSYVDKYIKNLKPSDLSLSLWGGDVVLYNLELRLDVIEKELKLPITFLSGKIHKLQIHIPWTKLGSEPVEITINTLECVVQLRYPDQTADDVVNSTSEVSAVSEQQNEQAKNPLEEKGDAPPSGYVQSLVNRVVNNVSICVNNVILKYLEDDIVLSLNMKSAETFSVNSNWEKAFVDVVAPDFLLQKVCNISDLTICLDKRSSSGKIELYQDPLLYKCGLSCRMLLKYDNLLRPLETIFNVYSESADVSLTDQQLPMFMRLVNLCVSLYYGTLDLPGCNYKSHPARKVVETQKTPNASLNVQSENLDVKTDKGSQPNPEDDWVEWMWSLVPNLGDEEVMKMTDAPAPTPLLIFGAYVSQVTVTIKLTGKVSEGNFFGGQRFEFKPLLSFELSGGAMEVVMKGDEFFDAQLGVSSITGWTIANCVCTNFDDSVTKDAAETDEKEDLFLSIGNSREESSDSSGFLTGSLFYSLAGESSLEAPKLIFDAEEFLKVHNETLALRRYGAVFIDYLYTMQIEPEKNQESGEENVSENIEDVGDIRLVNEVSFKRLILGPTHVQLSATVVHAMELVTKLSFEDIVPRKEKSELFYDEFVEKQLLAGNISKRDLGVTIVAFSIALPTADHGKRPLTGQPQSNRGPELHSVSSQQSLHSIQEQDPEEEAVFQPTCFLQINRVDFQLIQPMNPTELIKLTMSNAEYPAGKAMLECAYRNVSVQVFGIQVNLSQLHPEVSDVAMVTVVPPFSAAASLRASILPQTWGGAELVKSEAHFEVPSCQVHVTKPQFLFVTHILDSWIRSTAKPGKIEPVSKVLLDSTFHALEGEPDIFQPELQFRVSNTEVQFSEVLSSISVSGSVGSINASLKSAGDVVSEHETTPLLEGPSDTSQIYTGNLFRSIQLQHDIVESTGPVLSFTLQLPRAAFQSDSVAHQGPLNGEHMNGVILCHIKGITACLDPLLYKWISFKPPTQMSSPSTRMDREKTKTTRHQSLTRTPSTTTPRKKSFARGRGSVSSPAKEDKKDDCKTDGQANKSPANDSVQDSMDGRKAFESWLFDKLPFIIAMELQVEVKSVAVLLPEKHVPHETSSKAIALNYSIQALNQNMNSFPATLVCCLPSLKLTSANHAPMPVRQSLPVNIRHRDPRKRETLPWTLEARNLAVYSLHMKSGSSKESGDFHPVVHYLLSKVSSTAVLASARTSFSPTSPSLVSSQIAKQGAFSGRRVSTLGFCVHTDFQPIEVSCSQKQMQLVANLLEALLITCISKPSKPGDVTSCKPVNVPPTPVTDLKRTVSLTSSSAMDQVEVESAPSESVSSATFTQVQQTSNPIRVSLWIQWTLPRFVANLYSRAPGGCPPSAVCVSAELEDLTASIDYQDTLLQMQYKVGAVAGTHYTKSRNGVWTPGPLNGILLSCNDIISSKSLFTASTRRSSSGRREAPGHAPHGFLTVMYKWSSLHLKRRKSTSSELITNEEEYFKDLHEVRINVQPFDVVLWCPAIVSAFNAFDLSLLERFSFLAEREPVVGSGDNVVLLKQDEESKAGSTTFNVELLPLIFLNMRNLRLFVPSVNASEEVGVPSDGAETRFQEDMTVLQLSSVTASPYPENPIARTVLNHSSYEKFRKFGRSSRQALGYDVHDVQYQLDMCGFGVWSGSWAQLCGSIKRDDGLDAVGITVDQNPALEWNTHMWRGKEEVHVTPIISGSDFRIVLAPAISIEKSMTVQNKSVSEDVPVCGWSLEFNVVTDVDCFLNKNQIQLLQGLLAENAKILSTLTLSLSTDPTSKTSPHSTGALPQEEAVRERERERIDSGFESAQTDVTKRFIKNAEGPITISHGKCRPNSPQIDTGTPWEVFLTGRKLTVAIYARLPDGITKAVPASLASSKIGVPGRVKHSRIKPVFRVELVHPALIVNTHTSGPRIELSCFDVSMAGASPERAAVCRVLPEPADFDSEWLKTGTGVPNPHSGILPSLVTTEITDFLCGPADVSIDLGRPVHINLNVETFKELTEFLDGLVLPVEDPEGTKDTSKTSSGRTSFLRSLNVCTTDMSVQISAPSEVGSPSIMGSLTGVKTTSVLKTDLQSNLNRVDTRLQLHGVGLSTSVHDRCRPLLRPFSCSIDVETVWTPHSRDIRCQSGSGLPQVYACVDAAYLQIDVGQEHVACLSLLAAVSQHFMGSSTEKERSEEKSGESKGSVTEDPEFLILSQSFDDIRAGLFRYVTVAGDLDIHHPEHWEIVFSSDSSDRPPTMTWRYPEPRALSTVELVPLPLTTPVLVNTLNMGDEYKVPCLLRYWDPTQKCYISYKDFHLSETSTTFIELPDPGTADPSDVVVAAEWQIVLDVTVDIEFPDDGSLDDDDGGSTYTNPYRSMICATSLAASVKVNSVVRPSLNPALSAQVNISMLEVKFTNHLQAIGQAVPRYLTAFNMDLSLPTDQEFLLITIEGLNAVIKDVGGRGGFLHVQTEWNCHAEVLDYGDLIYRSLLSPFDMSFTAAVYHEGRTRPVTDRKGPSGPPVWLDVAMEVGSILAHVSQSTLHTVSLAAAAWGQAGCTDTERIAFNHYIICNDTHVALRLGQVDTDESLFLGSRQAHAYSWRTPRSVKESPRLHVCIETEGDWRWSEPFDIDSIGVFSRTIHHRLHSATLFIEIKKMSGVQKQVVIRGSHLIVSRLSIDVDVQILTNPSLNSSQSSKAPFQVLEDVSLLANTTLPSYVISHGGLAGVRIRIPNATTWSDTLPLEHVDGEGKSQHLLVQLLGVKDFQTFHFWYSVEKPGSPDQLMITLSPLFVLRSHLPEQVLMNVFTAKTNSSSVHQLFGHAQEQQMYSLVPNSWHHLTFQFTGSRQWSSPSVPLNTTLTELANRVKADVNGEEETPLTDIWPYCGSLQKLRSSGNAIDEMAESSLVRNVEFAGHVTPLEGEQPDSATSEGMHGSSPHIPAIEVQCRVLKRWSNLSSLLVDVLPWCLLVNKTEVPLLVRDLERDVTLELAAGSVVAPHRFTGKIQLGTLLDEKNRCWSDEFSIPSDSSDSRTAPTPDADNTVSASVAFVLSSGEIRGARWSVTRRMFRGIKILSVDQRFHVINNVGKALLAHPMLVATGKKLCADTISKTTAVHLSDSVNHVTPIAIWDVPSPAAVVLNSEGNPSFSGHMSPVLFLAFTEKQPNAGSEVAKAKWSRPVFLTPEVMRQSVAVSCGQRSTHQIVVTSHIADGVVYIVLAMDPAPRLVIHNDCPFTIQFGQTIPPQSPSQVTGSSEKIVIMEQTQGLGEIPEVAALSSTHYELPIMREWFTTSSEVQRLPEFHIQALYDVNVAELSEREGERGELLSEVSTEVPQGWSKALDLNTDGEISVNLPGRGQVMLNVCCQHLCAHVRIQSLGDGNTVQKNQVQPPPSPTFHTNVFICQFVVTVVDEITNFKNPYEVFRVTADGIEMLHTTKRSSQIGGIVCPEFSLSVGAFQIDNQLQDDSYEFSVILIPTDMPLSSKKASPPRRPSARSRVKPLVSIKGAYEPATLTSCVFLSSLEVSLQPLTLYIEDTFLYRLGDLMKSFLPPLSNYLVKPIVSEQVNFREILEVTSSVVNPVLIGRLQIKPVTFNVTLHASVKLFLAVDDSPLALGQFDVSPVFLPASALIQKLSYHYVTAALFKAGWLVGSLELLGNPAGLVRSFSQGVADFFYMPYDGLTRGPGAFVSGMSRGMSSFVRHLSTGALTSITSLASSMARNLDRLSMDDEHLRLLEEQRCKRPKKVLTGLSQGLGGFGLGLLGAVAGIVDQPIQGIRRASDVREAASGIITGVGKGLIGVVTKPLGGAMELVSQTGQGILQGAGLTRLPNRLFTPGERLDLCTRNSNMKYFWKMLHQQTDNDLLLHLDATVVTSSGHDYDGAVLLTKSTLYIVGSTVDAIQQTFQIRDISLQEDEEDNRAVAIVNQPTDTKEEEEEGIDRLHDSNSGDVDRLKQFLRDARAQALAQVSPQDPSESGLSSAGQRFVMLIDPLLRRTLMQHFYSAKRWCISDAEK